MNDAAEAYLDYYLDSEETAFAVLLEGRWGSGKTYFLRRYMEKRAVKADPIHKGRIHLYVSLNGVSSTSEITAQFFAQSAPLLGGKTASLLGLAVARAANSVTGGAAFDVDKDGGRLKEFFTNLDGQILVFDDLERCHMPLGEVLGFINNYVEHEGHKVIVLAAENEILRRPNEEYAQRKEKLVGKTLKVGSDAAAVYDLLVSGMRTVEAKSLAQASRAEAVATFKASGIENFRSLRAILDDFDRLVGALDAKLRSSPTAMTRLLVMMIALGMEQRSGVLTNTEVAAFQSGIYSQRIASISGREPTEHQQKITAVSEKYGEVSWGDPVVPPENLAALFASGSINAAEINQHLFAHPLIADPTQLPAWRRLWSWYELNQADYQIARQAFLKDLTARRYTDPAVILHAAGVVRSLAAANDNILGRRSVASYIRAYVDDVVRSGHMETGGNLFDFEPTGAFGLGFKTNDEPGFDVIMDAVRGGLNKAIAVKMKMEAPLLLDRLSGSRDAYPAIYEYGYGPEKYGAVAVLASAPINAFADLLIVDGRPNDRLFAALAERYGRISGTALLVEELWTKKLKKRLASVAASCGQPHQTLLRARIGYYFDKIEAAFTEMRTRA